MRHSLPIAASILAGAYTVLATPAVVTPAKALNARQTDLSGTACAQASSASVSYRSTHPSATAVRVPADIAYDCVTSVPLDVDAAVNLTLSLKPLAQLQSTIDFLRFPPEGYLYDAVDIPRLLDAIETKLLSSNSYQSEYDFQIDLRSALIMAKDGHFAFNGDLASVFHWHIPDISVVSLSPDGVQLPKIYAVSDIVTVGDTEITVNEGAKVSPITHVNGMDVVTYLMAASNAETFQDPDANWNNLFFRVQLAASSGALGAFTTPAFYPGPTTEITFENGTVQTINNYASTTYTFDGVTSGQDLYNQVISPDLISTPSTNSKRSLERRDSSSSNDAAQNYYPEPEVADSYGIVAGYFLDGSDSDIAVLTVSAFEPSPEPSGGDYMVDFQQTVQNFLSSAVENQKTGLIIDLQGNGGGSVDLALDLAAQLFPSVPINTTSNMRASWGMYSAVQAASNAVELAQSQGEESSTLSEDLGQPFDYQNNVTPDLEPFNSATQFYGPVNVGRGTFTNFFQLNWTDPLSAEFGYQAIEITSTGSRTNFTQPFDASSIIMLTDGYCASACTIFSELVKRQGVQVITMGGRPQTGPMQAVGGVKGSQVFNAAVLERMLDLYYNETLNTNIEKARGTTFDNFDWLPLNRGTVSVNGKNQFRYGDTTQTPLQFVYEAADCRIWYTIDMVADPTVIWSTVSSIAFSGDSIDSSKYCVQDSTQHPTSLSGGLDIANGDIGPQTPPNNAKPTVTGFLFNGTSIIEALASNDLTEDSPVDPSVLTSDDAETTGGTTGSSSSSSTYVPFTPEQVSAAVSTVASGCSGYDGDEWFVQLFCNAMVSQGGSKSK